MIHDYALPARTPTTLNLDGSAAARWMVAGSVLLLIIAVAVRLYQPTGWLGSDDSAYYSAAEHILTGTPITRAHHHYARMAIIVPVAASVALFGHQTWAVALPMFVASVLGVILVVILGRLLFGWREGLLAGLIVSMLPYFRVLSTTAYADTHVCLWVTASVLFCVLALRADCRKKQLSLFLGCGFALGLAISSKVFAATTLCALVALAANARWNSRRQFLAAAGAIAIGGMMFFLMEGLFYSHYANDFLFSLHAHEQSQTGVPAMAGESAAATTGIAALIWDRLTLLMCPSVSGWGWVGAAFWPAILLSLLFGGAARCMAVWAAGIFLLIAFVPVSFAGGYQPYPLFHGRHILPACIPFALCLACVLIRCVTSVEDMTIPLLLRERGRGEGGAKSWLFGFAYTILLLLVVASGIANINDLRGFRDRPTGRVGEAIREFVARTQWDDVRPIFMTPSSYWRYRILFPENLRARIKIAAASDAPDWWKNVTPDIAARLAPLTSPAEAYFVVTPDQLAGGVESWDYGVGLPADQLQPWRDRAPSLLASRSADRTIVITSASTVDAPIAMLFEPQSDHHAASNDTSTTAWNH